MGANGFKGFDPYLTKAEVADRLGISLARVDELIAKKQLLWDPVAKDHTRGILLSNVMSYEAKAQTAA